MANYGSPIEDRYVIEDGTGCWVWIAANTGFHRLTPYGVIHREGHRKAHRYMYAKHKGDIPEGMYVLHNCDNTLCVNPDHLRVGTQTENMEDRKKAARENSLKGSDNPAAKLNEEKVYQIRRRLEAGEQCAALGREFGVSEVAIGLIKRRQKWQHVK